MTPQKVDITRLPGPRGSEFYAFTVEKEAADFAEMINQPRYYWFAENHTYYVPILPGQLFQVTK